MQAILDRVSQHLQCLDIKLHCALNPKASASMVDAAQRSFGCEFPQSYIDFVTQQANGFALSWKKKRGRSAQFEMIGIDSAVSGAVGMREWRFYDDDAATAYGFPYVKDSNLAMKTNKAMRQWLPIHREGNGDFISIDLNADRLGMVIFDSHAWLDGGTGENGFLMAPDLMTFFERWGHVCFCPPKTLWWKSVLKYDGVDWDSDHFDREFRLGSGKAGC